MKSCVSKTNKKVTISQNLVLFVAPLLKSVLKVTGKQLQWDSILVKNNIFTEKQNSTVGVFMWTLHIFSEDIFYIPPKDKCLSVHFNFFCSTHYFMNFQKVIHVGGNCLQLTSNVKIIMATILTRLLPSCISN